MMKQRTTFGDIVIQGRIIPLKMNITGQTHKKKGFTKPSTKEGRHKGN